MNHSSDAATSLNISVGIVADDLTGATDSATQFARIGWPTQLILANSNPVSTVTFAAEPHSVLAIVTNSRAKDGPTARAATASAVTRLVEAGAGRLFLKIDSTMRGSVTDQILGALDAWSAHHPDAFAVVCSAYPSMGRTVHNRRILIDGVGVERTAIGRDPVTPLPTSELCELIPRSVHVALTPGSAAEHSVQIEAGLIETTMGHAARADGSRVITVDAVTQQDLQMIARAVVHLGPQVIPVGSAGLATELARVWADLVDIGEPHPVGRVAVSERVVIVLSSLHPVSRHQHSHLLGARPAIEMRTFAPPLMVLLDPGAVYSWISGELTAEPELPRIVVIRTPEERPELTVGAPFGASAAAAIAEGIATITATIFNHREVGSLILIGGDGAKVVLDRFNANAIAVTGVIKEGIPIGVIEGGRAHGLTVITKAGGFGTATSLTDIVDVLLTVAQPEFSIIPIQGELP